MFLLKFKKLLGLVFTDFLMAGIYSRLGTLWTRGRGEMGLESEVFGHNFNFDFDHLIIFIHILDMYNSYFGYLLIRRLQTRPGLMYPTYIFTWKIVIQRGSEFVLTFA